MTWSNDGTSTSITLLSVSKSVSLFLGWLSDEIFLLTKHHYISEIQKDFLKICKADLQKDTCIVLMDFSENYAFVIQNCVQAFYYNNSQATVHSTIMYYRKNNQEDLTVMSFCVISDSLQHTASTVFAFHEEIMKLVRTEFPFLKKMIY